MPIRSFGPFVLDTKTLELWRAGEQVELGTRPLELLRYLVENPGRVITKAELIEKVWAVSRLSDSAVPTCVATIRSALGDDPSAPRWLETLRGRGYRFLVRARVEEQDPADDSPSTRSFVGRASEIASVEEALAGAAQRQPIVLLFSGPAGIGKTRLLDETARRARMHGFECAHARCREDAGAPPLWPWVQVVRTLTKIAEAEDVAFKDLAPTLGLIDSVSQAGANAPGAETAFEGTRKRFQLFDTVACFLGRVSSARPIAILFDDAHRADLGSLHLLLFTIRELRDARILFAASRRGTPADEVPEVAAQLASIAREPHTRASSLPELNLAETTALLRHTLPERRNADAIASRLFTQSSGNPFLLVQLLRNAELVSESERPSKGIALPVGTREAILTQLSGLPRASRDLLAAASVCGRGFQLDRLSTSLGIEPSAALSSLEPAIERGLIERISATPGLFRFVHLLIRDALYDEIAPVARAKHHLALAQAIESRSSSDLASVASELAYHYFEAAHIGGAWKAHQFALLAANHANKRMAYESARDSLGLALRVLGVADGVTQEHRCEVLIALGQAEIKAENRERGRRILEDALLLARASSDSGRLLAEIALSLAPGPFSIEVGVHDRLLVAALEEALFTAGTADDARRSQLEARLCLALTWADAEPKRHKLAESALRGARASRQRHIEAEALVARHSVLAGGERLAERLAIADEVGRLATESGSSDLLVMHRILRVTGLMELGDLAGLEIEVESYRREAERLHLPHVSWYVPLFLSCKAFQQADFDRAAQLATEFREIGAKVSDVNSEQSFSAQSAMQVWERGAPEILLKMVKAYSARFPTTNIWRSALGIGFCVSGDRAGATAAFSTIAPRGFEHVPRNEVWSSTLATASLVCTWIGDCEHAAVLYDLLRAGLDHFAILGFGVASFGSVAMHLGMLAGTMGKFELALEHFAHALAQNERVGARQWVVHTHVEKATMLLAADPMSVEGLEAAERARELAASLGMTTILRRATALLEAHGR